MPGATIQRLKSKLQQVANRVKFNFKIWKNDNSVNGPAYFWDYAMFGAVLIVGIVIGMIFMGMVL